MNVRFHQPQDAPEWDAAIEGTPEAGLGQSYFWARVLEDIEGARPVFLTIEEGGVRVLSHLFHIRWPFDRPSRTRTLRNQLLGNLVGSIEWFDGPVLHRQDRIEGVLDQWLSALERFGTRRLL